MRTTVIRTVLPLAIACALLGACSSAAMSSASGGAVGSDTAGWRFLSPGNVSRRACPIGSHKGTSTATVR